MSIGITIKLFFIFFNLYQERDIDFYQSHEFTFNGFTMPYKFLTPHFKTDDDVPLIIFLHGSGERGKDNIKQLTHGGKFFLDATKNKKFNSYVIFPQCDNNYRWSSHKTDPWIEDDYSKNISLSLYGDLVVKLVEDLIENHNIDRNRIYIMGLSMGGYGTFDLTSKRPDLFAAAVPICGGSNLDILQNAINIPHWIFHGDLDPVVPVQKSRDAFNFLINKKSHHKYTEFKDVYHNSWENVFEEGKFLKWLFSKSKN